MKPDDQGLRMALFGGREYERRIIGRVYGRGPALLVEYYGKNTTLDYYNIAEANDAKRVLLDKLEHRRPF